MSEQALLSADDAASYLGVSRSYFDEHLRRLLPPAIDLRPAGSKRPLPRWERIDLDAFIASRRRKRAS